MLIKLNNENISLIDINKYKFINFRTLYENNNTDYSEYKYMIINYTDTPCIGGIFEITNSEKINNINEIILKFNGKKILLIHDIHDYTFRNNSYNSFKDFCKNVKIDLVIGNYIYNSEYFIIQNILSELQIKHCVVPNTVDDTIFKNYNNEKEYDILIYGSMIDCYVLRKRVLNIINHNKHNWKTRVITSEDNITGAALSNEINKSYLCVVCDSTFEYFVFKYIEIPLSNSLIVGSMPIQGTTLFDKNNYIHIDNNMSDEDITNIINATLLDKQSIIEKINMFSHKLEFYKNKYYSHYITLSIDFLENT